MPVTRKQKEEAVKKLKEKLGASGFVALLNFHGLSVAKAMELRRALKKAGGDYSVSKKTLFGVAAKDAGLELDKKTLEGEVGAVFAKGEDEALASSKEVAAFARKNTRRICYCARFKIMHRFFLNQAPDKEIIMIKDRALVHQMRDVLKLRKGERAAFFNANPECFGFDFIAELKNIEGNAAVFMFREKLENALEPSKKLVLYQSLIKKDKFEWILAKATEVGVSEIVPVISARSEKKSLNFLRCQTILKESAEQSGRAVIPKLHNEIFFEKAVLMAQNSGHKTYFADISEKENIIHGAGDRAINLFIGPEGGWEERELFAAGHAGFAIVSLGRLTLRSETAAVVASYTLLWG